MEPAPSDLSQSGPVPAPLRHANINRKSTNSGCGNVWSAEGREQETDIWGGGHLNTHTENWLDPATT